MASKARIVGLAALALFALADASQVRSVPPAPQNGSSPPTFYRDVLPILQERCQSCHRVGEIAPMPLVTFEETHRWSQAIAHMTATRQMPPWFAEPDIGHFSNDPSLTRKQIATLAAWAAAGAPAGDPRDAPAARHWARGWNIAQPDVVVKMPEPVALPATGDVEYTYEIVPTGFTEDRWVRMSEIRPAMRANVHHAVVYIRPPDSTWLSGAPVGAPFTAASLPDEKARHDDDVYHQRSSAGLRAGQRAGRMARGPGEADSARLGSRVSDALRNAGPGGFGPDQYWAGVREAAAQAARIDAAIEQ